MTTLKRTIRGHRSNTIPAVAERLHPHVSEGMLRRAIKKGEVKVIPFGGLDRIPDEEEQKIRELFGLPTEPETL